MNIVIKRWGNGALLPLSKELRKHLHCDIGEKVTVSFTHEGLLIRSAQAPQYNLKELLSSCTRQNTRLDLEDTAWLQSISVGKEI